MGELIGGYHDDDIVIVGFALNTSAGDNSESFWENISNNIECINKISGQRKEDFINFCKNKYNTDDLGLLEGGLIKNIDLFDNKFFHIRELDALCSSPCMRMHLEVMWKALEDAGYKESDLNGEKIDVYTGIVTDAQIYEYRERVKWYNKSMLPVAINGNLLSVIPAALAYYLNLKGAAAVIDTACSSSSTAIIQASRALKSGNCNAAVVAGGRVIYSPVNDADEMIGIESSDFRARPFDETADGTVHGEGVAAIVIKKYSQALIDNDRIYAVIKGYATNQSGKTARIGVTDHESQMNVIINGIKNSGLNAEDIQYCEAHGTGTYIGDSLEILGIEKALRESTEKKGFCGVGSIKANIGHTYGASSIISIIKCILAMKKGFMPPSPNFLLPNKKINFIASPLFMSSKLTEWISEIKRCLVNCYGISGVNCCIVLEDYKNESAEIKEIKSRLPFAITAKNTRSLKKLLKSYSEYLGNTHEPLENISYSTMVRRNHFKHKLIFLAMNREELLKSINEVLAKTEAEEFIASVDNISSFYSNKINRIKKDHTELADRFRKNENESDLRSLCEMYLEGCDIDWKLIYDRKCRYVTLPSYEFDIHRIWATEESLKKFSQPDEEVIINKIEVFSSYDAVSSMERELGELLCEYVKIGKVDVDDNLFALGLNSVQGMNLINNINKKYNTELSIINLFEYDSIRKLSWAIEEITKKEGHIIVKAERKQSYDLSRAQSRIYLQDKLIRNNLKTLIHGVYIVNGRIDTEKLEKAVQKVIQNNDVLHTALIDLNGVPQQVVKENWQFNIESGKQCLSIDDEMKQFVVPFDLAKPPFIRIKVIEMEDGRDIFMFCAHHSVFDGTSILTFLDQMNAYYCGNDYQSNEYTYIDYSESMKEYYRSEEYAQQCEYWKQQYDNKPVVSNLQKSYDIAEISHNSHGKNFYFEFSKELTERISRYASKMKVTVFIELYASLAILLNKYSGDSDICVGIPYAGRNNANVEKMLGVFINTLAIRTTINQHDKVSDVIENSKKSCIQAFQNSDYGYEEIVKMNGRDPFNVMFIYQNMGERIFRLECLTGEEYNLTDSEAKYDITIELFPVNDTIKGNVEYNSALVSEEYIEKMIVHLQNVIMTITSDRDFNIEELSLLNDEQNSELIALGRGKEKPIVENVIDMWYKAAMAKDAEAIRFHDRSITYSQLDQMSDKIANYILNNICTDKKMIPVLMHRSEKIIATLIGILKAGYSYIPIDPEYPENRIRYIVTDCGASILFTERGCTYQNNNVKAIYIEDIIDSNNISEYCDKRINYADFNEVCYTIYTSGTTGNPKGVSVRHREIANFVQSMDSIEHLNPSDKMLCVTTICFDIFVLECFCTLCSGGCMVLADESECVDVIKLSKLIEDNNVNIIQFTPSRMQMILLLEEGRNAMKNLKTIFLGGESLHFDVLNSLKQLTGARIINMYGPTETTVWSSYKDVTNDEKITIGRPLDNTNIYILTANNQLQYKGGIGEIAIGGAGVSKGYVNNERLTTEKFIDLFSAHERVYKTGDLGKWDDDGNLICLGRNDHQVKIRGYRVELGEIEELINQYETVVKVAAITKVIGTENVIIVFVKTQNDEPLEEEKLMKFSFEHLPHYMIPYAFIQVKEFPYTPNKKLDRKALALMDISLYVSSVEHTGRLPQSDTEKVVYFIWKIILEKSDLNCEQDFFQVGGNSLLLILMLSEIKKKFSTDISVADLYECRTIEAIARLIEEKSNGDTSVLIIDNDIRSEIDEIKIFELSGAQLRLYLLEQLEPVSCKYNIPSAFIVDGELDIEKLENAINVVISRHEILRTSFEIIGDIPMQKIHDDVKLEIIRVEKITDIDWQIKTFIQKFDLEIPPLIHAMVGRIDDGHMLFLFDMHHLITDGTSAQLFINEIEKIYNGETLEAVVHQYKEYTIRSNKRSETSEYKKQEKFWKNVFDKEYKKAKLPTVFVNNSSNGSEGKNYYFDIGYDLCRKMTKYIEKHNYTEFMILISALDILIHKYTGTDDITIGTPVFGRNSYEENQMLGVFINTLVMRNNISDDLSVKEVFEATKKMSLNAFSNSDYGFQDLVQQVRVERDLDQNPLFDIMFVYQVFGEKEICFGNAKFRKYHIKDIVPKYEMSFEMIPRDNSISCVLEYDSQLYSELYITSFTEQYLNILNEILSDDTQLIKNIRIENENQEQLIIERGKGEEHEVKDTVVDLWYKNFEKHPDDIAVINSGKKYSYSELEKTSNIIANYLIENFGDTDMVFCVLIKREYLLIATLIGILKAGGSYIPIDVNYPDDRIMHILNVTDAAAYLSTGATNFKCESVHFLNIDDIISLNVVDKRVNRCRFENIAYTIFTSGSTGKPKGVVIGQKAISNFVQAINRIKSFNTDSCMLGVTTVSFDIFALECYVTLCYGGKLIFADDETVNDIGELSKLIRNEGVDIIQFTPSRILMLLEIPEYAQCLKQVETVFIGGEALPQDTLNRLRKCTDARIINVYGPTETTVWSTYKDVTNDDNVTIGRPLDNTDVYVIDKENRLMFRNGTGELSIGGLGVANGYFNNSALTEERFITTDYARGSIYKTGDLAGWDDNGNLFCLGRIDNQVKIRGYRVELEEIDHVILDYNSVCGRNIITRCVTIAKNIDGVNELYSFVELEKNISVFDCNELKKYAESKLPFYMIPKAITFVDDIPFTGNGKVDRNALQKYATEETVCCDNTDVFENETEKILHRIWIDVLNVSHISCNQKFFEIGGNSLLLIKMLKLIREKFNVNITAGELFKLQTIRKIAEWIDKSGKDKDVYFKEIEIPEKIASHIKQSGVSYTGLELEYQGAENSAYCVYIKLFVKVMAILCEKNIIGINICTDKESFKIAELSADDIDSIENERILMAALSEKGAGLSTFVNNKHRNHIKLLFAVGQELNTGKYIKTFDIIVQMKYTDGILNINTESNNITVNKSAAEYIVKKTEYLYQKYYKL